MGSAVRGSSSARSSRGLRAQRHVATRHGCVVVRNVVQRFGGLLEAGGCAPASQCGLSDSGWDTSVGRAMGEESGRSVWCASGKVSLMTKQDGRVALDPLIVRIGMHSLERCVRTFTVADEVRPYASSPPRSSAQSAKLVSQLARRRWTHSRSAPQVGCHAFFEVLCSGEMAWCGRRCASTHDLSLAPTRPPPGSARLSAAPAPSISFLVNRRHCCGPVEEALNGNCLVPVDQGHAVGWTSVDLWSQKIDVPVGHRTPRSQASRASRVRRLIQPRSVRLPCRH